MKDRMAAWVPQDKGKNLNERNLGSVRPEITLVMRRQRFDVSAKG